jgi:hypothetical protein
MSAAEWVGIAALAIVVIAAWVIEARSRRP